MGKIKIINNYFKQLNLKKKHLKNFNTKTNLKNNYLKKPSNLIIYVINIFFSRSNTVLNLTDFAGNLKFNCSAGNLFYKGKNKKTRLLIVKSLIQALFAKFKDLHHKFVVLHLINVGSNKFWLLNNFKAKFFLKNVEIFNNYPYNGCRKKKMRRKKF